MAMNIITYSYELEQNKSIFGFKIMDPKMAKKYMKTITILSDNNSEFEFEGSSYPYSTDFVNCMKISPTEVKTLTKLFDLLVDNNESNAIRSFSRCNY